MVIRKRRTSQSAGSPKNLASLIRGLYGRVARRLRLDPSFVSRVARGERKSKKVETALRRDLAKIMAQFKQNRGRPAHKAAAKRRFKIVKRRGLTSERVAAN